MNWKSISNSQYSQLLGPLETKNENGKDSFRMFVKESHLNSGNFAHGGFLMSFLDNVMGNAAYKSFDNNPCVTISMNTHFTFSAVEGDELIGIPVIEKKKKNFFFFKFQIFLKKKLNLYWNGILKILNLKKMKNIN